MRQWLRSQLNYANVMVTLLAFIVLTGGTAVALSGSNTVQSDDLGPGSQVTAPDVAANAVNGTDIVNDSIKGPDIHESALPRGRKVESLCDPSGLTYVDCGTLSTSLPRSGLHVLIVASAQWASGGVAAPDTVAYTAGNCRIEVDGVPLGPVVSPGERQDLSDVNAEQSLTLTRMVDGQTIAPAAGQHTFGLACNQTLGDLIFASTYVSVAVLGPG